MGLEHEALTHAIIGAAYEVHREIGAGFLELVYQNAMVIACRERGLAVEQQFPIDVHFKGSIVGEYRADLAINRSVIVEIKAVQQFNSVHEAQLLNYLRATGYLVGLLINFGARLEFKRRVLTPTPEPFPRRSAPFRG